jgi:hypothetical protein
MTLRYCEFSLPSVVVVFIFDSFLILSFYIISSHHHDAKQMKITKKTHKKSSYSLILYLGSSLLLLFFLSLLKFRYFVYLQFLFYFGIRGLFLENFVIRQILSLHTEKWKHKNEWVSEWVREWVGMCCCFVMTYLKAQRKFGPQSHWPTPQKNYIYKMNSFIDSTTWLSYDNKCRWCESVYISSVVTVSCTHSLHKIFT